jgi:acyl-CoA reductase-like NAD-dependent aldehyde dehydrogenase
MTNVQSHTLEQLIIDGGRTHASDGGTFEVCDPSTGGPLATVAKATKADVDRAVTAAQNALDSSAGGALAPA